MLLRIFCREHLLHVQRGKAVIIFLTLKIKQEQLDVGGEKKTFPLSNGERWDLLTIGKTRADSDYTDTPSFTKSSCFLLLYD